MWDNCISTYASYELTKINYVVRNTGVHTFSITGTYPWTNMPCTLHIYVPLHCSCSLHIDPPLLHQWQKTIKYNFYWPCCYPIYANKKYTLKCHIYATCPNYLTRVYGEVCQYLCHKSSQCSQQHHQDYCTPTTQDNNNDKDDDDTFWWHRLPMANGQISQKQLQRGCQMCNTQEIN